MAFHKFLRGVKTDLSPDPTIQRGRHDGHFLLFRREFGGFFFKGQLENAVEQSVFPVFIVHGSHSSPSSFISSTSAARARCSRMRAFPSEIPSADAVSFAVSLHSIFSRRISA